MKFFTTLLTLSLFFTVSAQSWQDVGGGTNNSSHGMLTWNGYLVNLGSFNSPCARTALWDGSNWSCLPTTQMGQVARAGVVWNGNLVVVGDFWNTQQPCVGCNGVAMWDDVNQLWTPLGNGVNNDVLCCTVYNGDLIIGGDFTQASGVPSSRVVRYNSVTDTWESMGTPTDFDNDVRCMTVFQGELWVGGDFNNVGGNPPSDGVVKWDENTQSWVGGNSGVDLVGGVNETIRVLYVNPNDGNLYMGGHFPQLHDGDAVNPDPNMSGIAMYDGSNWYPLGSGLNEYCRAIHEYNGNLIAGGYFTTAGGVPAQKIAKWNGSTWSAMGGGFDGVGIDEYVKSATTWNGIFFAGGAYTQAEGGPMNFIAQWYEPVTSPPTAVINASASTICETNCVYFQDNSTGSPTSWNWSFPGATVTSSTLQNPGNICYNNPGNYTATLQACNSNGCTTDNFSITVTAAATVSVNDVSVCDGAPATLNAVPSSGGGSYLWTPGGQTTSSIVVTPGSTTSYTVEYTLSGCTTSDVATVTVETTPTVSVNNETICAGQSVTLTATPSAGGGNYDWSPGGQTTSAITVSPVSTTAYSIDYTLNGCTGSNTATVTVNPVYNSNENVSACENSVYTYPDGFNETITGSTSHTSLLTSSAGCDSIIVTNVSMSPAYSGSENISVCNGATHTYPDGFSETITGNTSHTSNLTGSQGCDSTIVTNVTMITAYNSTENISVCGSTAVTYPDGFSEVVTGNTSHTSLLTSVNGCDSIVVTNVTVNNIYNISENVNACNGSSVTYPDGFSETVTANTSHTSLLTSSAGCDSVIVTNVTVQPNYNTNESVTACQNTLYTYPDGFSETITANTVHTSLLSSMSGCDSVIVTNVTMTPAYNQSENIDICSGSTYVYPDGFSSTNITVNESHTSLLNTVNGCDSIIVTNLNVATVLNYTQNVSVCSGDDYTYPDGTVSSGMTANETHVSNLVSVNGCDSIITTNVAVNPVPSISVNSEVICAGENVVLTASPSIGGGTYLWSPGGATSQTVSVSPLSTSTYTVVYTLNGCESNTAISTITVNPMPDVTVNATINNVISVAQNNATYQWLDCNNAYAVIPGETNQDYSPVSNGLYAVEVNLNGCQDTSDCIQISTIGIGEIGVNEDIRIYPNPASKVLQVEGHALSGLSYQIIDMTGKKIRSGSLEVKNTIDISRFTPGVYFIEVNGRNYRFVKL